MAEFDSVIPAGGSGRLTAKVKTRTTQNGKLSKSVSVRTDAPGFEDIRLRLSFEAVTAVIGIPRYRVYFNAVEGESKQERLLLRRPDGEVLEVTPLLSTARSAVQVRAEPVTDSNKGEPHIGAKPGDVWLEVELVAQKQPFNHKGNVIVSTNHPDAPRLEIPLVVRVRPIIDVRPTPAYLWAAGDAPGDGRSKLLRIAHADRMNFSITSVEVSHPELFAATADSSEPRWAHSVRVVLLDGVTEESLGSPVQGTVTIRSSDPLKPVIEVPVEVAPRKDMVRARPAAQRPSSTGGDPKTGS